MTAFNIYCDESCHLEHDGERVMVVGALMLPANRVRRTAEEIRAIKETHGLPRHHEVKWIKVSNGKLQFYLDLVDYFFSQDDLRFRVLVVPDKSLLDCAAYGLTHDDFYFRIYYQMLRLLLAGPGTYRTFLDIKDTRSAKKTAKLGEVLSNKFRDFARERIKTPQIVRSQQVQHIQLADLLIGAYAYANRGLHEEPGKSAAKRAVVERIKQRSGLSLTETSSPYTRKVNVLVWRSAEELARV